MSYQSLPTEVLYADTANNMGTNFNTLPGNVTNAKGYSIQAIWTNGSNPIGDMNLQASNNGEDWSDIPASTLAVTGNSGNHIFNVSKNMYYNFVRLVYTRASGNANVVISMVMKA